MTDCPSLSVLKPELCIALKCTNTLSPRLSGEIKPYSLDSLNRFTVPVDILFQPFKLIADFCLQAMRRDLRSDAEKTTKRTNDRYSGKSNYKGIKQILPGRGNGVRIHFSDIHDQHHKVCNRFQYRKKKQFWMKGERAQKVVNRREIQDKPTASAPLTDSPRSNFQAGSRKNR